MNPHPILGLIARGAREELPVVWVVIFVVAAVFVLWVAYGVGKFLLRIAVGLIALGAIAGAVWWFWLGQ